MKIPQSINYKNVKPPRKTMTRAIVWASGLIEFTTAETPEGAILIAASRNEQRLREFIAGVARHGYKTEMIDGRPTKIRGTEHLLVPGVPETEGNQVKGGKALRKFCDWISEHASDDITVF